MQSRREVREPATHPFADAGFDPNQPRGEDGRWTNAATSLARAVEQAGHRGKPVRAIIGRVTDAVASVIASLVGVDVRGFTHAISNERISHIMQAHGDASVEALRGQSPITARDFGAIRQVVSKPTKLRLGRPNRAHGQPRIVFEGSVNGSRYRYVAEIQRGKKRLDAVSLWRW